MFPEVNLLTVVSHYQYLFVLVLKNKIKYLIAIQYKHLCDGSTVSWELQYSISHVTF